MVDMMEEVTRPAALLVPLRVPNKLLLGAGPSSAPPRVLHAGSQPLLGHLHPETIQVMDEIKQGLQYLFQTKNPVTLCISATGHAGMEAALSNILEPGDVALIGSNGFWGHRAADMAGRHGARAVLLQAELGEAISLAAAEEAVIKHKPRLLFLTQGESSTGVLQPLEGFGDMCHKYGTLLVVDTVASAGGTPLFTDRWGIDVVYTGSQKVLGAPPGLAPISFSPRAMRHIASRKKPCDVYYWDVMGLSEYWGCLGGPRKYHHTGPVSLFFALREALALLAEEGLASSWRRHQDAALRLHAALPRLGLGLFVSNPAHRLPTVTSITFPTTLDWMAVLKTAMVRHGVEISAGLGAMAGRNIRLGLMGKNVNANAVDFAIRVLEDSMKKPLSHL